MKKVLLSVVAVVGLLFFVGCGGGSDDSGGGNPANESASWDFSPCYVQIVDGGTEIGIQAPEGTISYFGIWAYATVSGRTVTLDTGGPAVMGSAVGGGEPNVLSGSKIVWDSLPQSGQDLYGSMTLHLENGNFVGRIEIPGGEIWGSPYSVFSPNSRVAVRRQ